MKIVCELCRLCYIVLCALGRCVLCLILFVLAISHTTTIERFVFCLVCTVLGTIALRGVFIPLLCAQCIVCIGHHCIEGGRGGVGFLLHLPFLIVEPLQDVFWFSLYCIAHH